MDEQTAASADICELAISVCQLDVDASQANLFIDTCPLPLDDKVYPEDWHSVVRENAKALVYILRSRMPICRNLTADQFFDFMEKNVRHGEDVGVDAIMPVYEEIKRFDEMSPAGISRGSFGRLQS